jgi:NAD-dependent deacetylase
MSAEVFQSAVLKAAALLRKARHAVVLTGAGVSTPSGIPDFRSADTGQWTRIDPMRVASLTAFNRRPKDFFNWLRPLAADSWNAQPNPAHDGLAEMENLGILKAVITQNIDGLHQVAGSKKVLEVHGSLRTWTCSGCRKKFGLDLFREEFFHGAIPHCQTCDAILKPDVVLFEESLPADVWGEAYEHCVQADLMMVVGSSLEIYPAASLPMTALDHQGTLIINTLSETYLDHRADVLLPFDVALTIPQIVAAI